MGDIGEAHPAAANDFPHRAHNQPLNPSNHPPLPLKENNTLFDIFVLFNWHVTCTFLTVDPFFSVVAFFFNMTGPRSGRYQLPYPTWIFLFRV